MNKAELIAAVVEQSKDKDVVSKAQVERTVNTFLNVVTSELKKGGNVALTGFGTFKVVARKSRTGRDPQTGKTLQIPSKQVPKFVAGKGLKDAVNA